MFPVPVSLMGSGGGALSFVLDGTAQDNASSATQVYTMAGAIPIGSLIVVVGGNQGNATLSSVADSKGNTYAVNQTTSGASQPGAGIAMAPCTVALSASDTITLTWSSSKTGHGVAIGQIVNPKTNTSAAFDKAANNTGSGTNPTVSTGVLAQANEIVIGAVISTDTTTGTQDAAFTTIGNLTFAGATRLLIAGYKIVAATTSTAYAPTLPTGTNWTEVVSAYKGL